jgi:hypothetical protein
VLVSAVGLALLLVGGYEAAGLRARLSPASLLIGASDVVRALDGSLFVASKLARVHVYSAEGRPLRGFEVPVHDFHLEVSGPDRLWVRPADGDGLAYDFDGHPVDPPAPSETAPPAKSEALRIDDGDVVEATAEGSRVLVRGYVSHGWMLAHVLAVGCALFAGGVLLLGGVLSTGRRPTT